MSQATIKVTILYDNSLWTGIFERDDETGYAVARKIFGTEPTDPELYEFVLKHYDELRFSEPQKDIKLVIKRKNHKRMLREVKKEMARGQTKTPMSRAQEALKLELEKNKKTRNAQSKTEKEAFEKHKFELRQLKKKEKMRGH